MIDKTRDAELLNELIGFRRTLHKYPEVSHQEITTADRVVEFVQRYNPTRVIKGLGGLGVAVVFGEDKMKKTIMVRAELDALPIQEINQFSHRSEVDGVSHKCGHDGHMTMIAGLGGVLEKYPFENLNVVLLFQHAEETGEGAKAIIEDPQFLNLDPDVVIALHNVPGYPMHQIVVKEEAFTPSVTSLIIELKGKTSHAAEPENGINPAMAVSSIIRLADELEINEDNEHMQLLTPVQVELGEEAFGVSAGFASLKYTLRAWSDHKLKQLKQDFSNGIFQIADNEKLGVKLEWTQSFSSNYNDKELVDEICTAANKLNLSVVKKEQPFKWGEDFGLFTQKYTGALFGLGAGTDTPALHNPDYDFPDELISTGVNMFYQILKQLNDK